MSEMQRLREAGNRTQQQVVDDLNDLARRLFAQGRVRRTPTFTVRQYSKWEGSAPPWPHPDTRTVLGVYWKQPLEALGLRPRGGPVAQVSLTVPMLTAGPGPTLLSSLEDQMPPWMAETVSAAVSATEWRIGEAEVELLRAAAQDMDAIDQQFGGAKLWRLTQANLHWAHHMIDRGLYDDALGRELHTVTGMLTTSLGWYCYDAGLQVQARAHFAEAWNAANFTDDDVLASRTLSNMCRQAVDLNKGREAVRFAQLAQTHAKQWRAPHRVAALLAIREAQGHARLGDGLNSEKAIRQAWRSWYRGESDRDPDWTGFLNEAELTCLEGMCRLDLGQAARAQRLLARSETLQDVAHSRNRGICLGYLSIAALSGGDIDHSVAATTEALRLIESGMSSTRAVNQLKIVHDKLAPHHRSSGVGDLLEQIRAKAA
ncbi:hypothetical protein [Streptomyces sp. NPDC001502]|uniref:hypothetical protein n=1 Tax=Streptomyces sp. NPDC001502 TaxID=3364578 RepID=UPI0036955F1B